MAGASVCGMRMVPPAAALELLHFRLFGPGPTSAPPPAALLLLLVIALLVMVGVRRVLLPYVRARHPDTGYIPGNEASHLLQHGANVPVIHAFLVLKGTLTAPQMVAVLRQAGIPDQRFRRLAQCVSARPDVHAPFEPQRGDWPAYWRPEEGFELARHVRHLPVGMDHASLTAYLGAVVNTPPPFDRSPWEVLLANGFAGREATALVVRLHHVLGDGLSLLALLEAITQPLHQADAGSSSLEAALRVGVKRPAQPVPASAPAATTTTPTTGARSSLATLATLATLGSAARRWLRLLGLGLRMSVELPWVVRREFVSPPREVNVFRPRGPGGLSGLSGKKAVGYRLTALDVPRVRRVKDGLGVKVNDLLLACAAGALRRMHGHIHDSLHAATRGGGNDDHSVIPEEENEMDGDEEEEEEVKDPRVAAPAKPTNSSTGSKSKASTPPPPAPPQTIRFFAPMSVRTNLRELADLDNQLSVLSIPLPVGPPCRLARLRQVHTFMTRVKSSTVPLGMALLTQASGHLPRALLEFQADYFCSKATGVLTNVPGPVHARTLHGKTIEEFIFFVPAIADLSMVLSTLTYAGRLSVGMVVDEAVPLKCDDFLAFFVQEFEAYEAHVLDACGLSHPTTTKHATSDKVKTA